AADGGVPRDRAGAVAEGRRELRGPVLPAPPPHDRSQAAPDAAPPDLDRGRDPALGARVPPNRREHRSRPPADRALRGRLGAALLGDAPDGPGGLGEGPAVRARARPRPARDRTRLLQLRLGPSARRAA